MDNLVLVVMVKNEEESIIRTLEPWVKHGFRDYFVYDTGSSDLTVSVVKEYFMEKGLNGIVKEENFIDFAASRNRCNDLVGEYFPGFQSMMLDSEWYPVGLEHLVNHCMSLKGVIYDVCHINLITSDGLIVKHSRLFGPGTSAKFKGPVHEYVHATKFGPPVPEQFYIEYKPEDVGRRNTKLRWYRDLSLLYKEYGEHEEKERDPRYVFYLAQTFECLNDWDNAIKFYKERSKMDRGFNEEVYISLYRIGNNYMRKGDNDNAIKYYNEAITNRPHRVEAYVAISRIYGDKHPISYIYLKESIKHNYSNDILFVEKTTYDSIRWERFVVAAYARGEFMESFNATKYLVSRDPNSERLQSNLGLTIEALPKNFTPKILNLILYSKDEAYEQMYEILTTYLNYKDIEHYFYCFDNSIEGDYEIVENILYFKGTESFIPGILDKTLKAFELFKDYNFDYIIRSNISTVINFDYLLKYLSYLPFDFGGPFSYCGNYVSPSDGMTEEKHKIYGKYGFVGGCCTIFSKKIIHQLLEHKTDIQNLEMIDDLAIGIGINKFIKNYQKSLLSFPNLSFNTNKIQKYKIIYRNKRNNRLDDVQAINELVSQLI